MHNPNKNNIAGANYNYNPPYDLSITTIFKLMT